MTLQSGIEFSICTYNRSFYLKQCVEALLKQMVAGKTMLTVIDNNSMDDTKAWVVQMMDQYESLRYVSEPIQGLSHARNTAWREAVLPWVFYVDDDCLPPEDFVSNALAIITEHTTIDAFGGPIKALFTDPIPEWLPTGFGSFKMPFEEVTQISKGYIRGPSFLVRQSILAALHGFDTHLGVKGNKLQYGEELELQIRMRKAGYSIAYAPLLSIGHFMRTDKLSMKWILQSEFARRRDKMLFEPISLPLATLHLGRTLLGRLLWTPVHIYQLITTKSYSMKRALYDILKPIAYSGGAFVGVIMRSLKISSRDHN